ncbi:MAG TPA: ATP-dependent metallopeptidase FtsH/Yme1/Tma family protein [Pseudolabrys sp.]|nr:ATP-dependent metallopeptidase FtsH/Yme1/Tma family protein [Pseudolabrys sp.]
MDALLGLMTGALMDTKQGNLRNFTLFVVVILVLLAAFTAFQKPVQRAPAQAISVSQFTAAVDQNRVREVLIPGREVRGTFTDGTAFRTETPNDQSFILRLQSKGVALTTQPRFEDQPWLVEMIGEWLPFGDQRLVSQLVSWLPFIALIGVWFFLSRRMPPRRDDSQ